MMKKWQPISRRWRELSINTKFTATFGLLLALIVLVAVIGGVALTTMRTQSDSALQVSAEIRRLVLQMDCGLERARRLQRDFFLQYPTIGLAEANRVYAPQVSTQITQVISRNAELQRLISTPDVSDDLRKNDVHLAFYFHAVERYGEAFDEAVALANDEAELQTQLKDKVALLEDALRATSEHDVIKLYHEMRLLEKDYGVTRRYAFMQSAFDRAFQLRQAVNQLDLTTNQKTQIFTCLDDYQSTAQEILKLDREMRGKLDELDLKVDEIDPISTRLVDLANKEVERAARRIDQTSGLVIVVLGLATLIGLTLAGLTSGVLSHSITHNVIELTQAAGELQAGNLAAHAQVDSADELGQLAAAFNAMAAEIQAQVAEMTALNQTLRASEWRFRKLFEDSLDAIGITTPEGQFVDVNEAVVHLTGYSREQLLERGVQMLYTRPERRQEFRRAIEQTGVAKNFELQVRRQDGTLRDVLANATLQRAEDGTVLGVQTIIHDITEQVRAREVLARYNAELERLTYVTAHHLQEPLFTVVNYSQLMAQRYRGRFDVEADRFIDFVVSAATRMKRLLQDLLAYLELDKRATMFGATHCDVVLQKSLARLRQTITDQKAVVTHNALPVVMADAQQLGQVFDHLLENALKFHGDAPPQVHVSATSCETDTGTEWRFSVRDNGIGIAPEHIERIFQVFERLHTWEAYPGTGIGLATCRKIVERHGGRIWVESEPGQGSTFYFTIPN
jgi:PAS domain S-box-containing protein